MGIVDIIWGNVSLENVVIGIVVGISLYYIWFRVDEYI